MSDLTAEKWHYGFSWRARVPYPYPIPSHICANHYPIDPVPPKPPKDWRDVPVTAGMLTKASRDNGGRSFAELIEQYAVEASRKGWP